MQKRRAIWQWKVWATALGGALLASVWVAGEVQKRERENPKVSFPGEPAKRMSEWAFEVAGKWWGGKSYGYPKKYREIFKQNRETAIPNLMEAVRFQPSRLDLFRISLARKLPRKLGAMVRPTMPSMTARWLGVLALSDLARQEPDERITQFFLECMRKSNVPVRKVAAYEAGPWLSPAAPEAAIQILEAGLRDSHPDVRNDACRRIAASATSQFPEYRAAARKLTNEIRRVRIEAGSGKLYENAQKALTVLESGEESFQTGR